MDYFKKIQDTISTEPIYFEIIKVYEPFNYSVIENAWNYFINKKNNGKVNIDMEKLFKKYIQLNSLLNVWYKTGGDYITIIYSYNSDPAMFLVYINPLYVSNIKLIIYNSLLIKISELRDYLYYKMYDSDVAIICWKCN